MIAQMVLAQAATPDRLLEFVKDVGAPWAALILFIVLIMLIVWKLGKPWSDAFVSANQAKERYFDAAQKETLAHVEMQRQSVAALQQVSEAVSQSTEVQKSNVTAVQKLADSFGHDLKASDEAQAAGREEAVEQINTHTSNELKQVRTTLGDLAGKVAALQKSIGQPQDERTLLQIAENLSGLMQRAVVFIEQVAEESTTRLPVLSTGAPKNEGKPSEEEAVHAIPQV